MYTRCICHRPSSENHIDVESISYNKAIYILLISQKKFVECDYYWIKKKNLTKTRPTTICLMHAER